MIDKIRIQNAITEILYAIGEDPNREGLIDTPLRVANMYEEIFSGINKDPKNELKIFSEKTDKGIIIVKDIPLFSMCEHHLLPFFGKADIAYIPKNYKILGLSKIARVVDTISKRPQLQERLCNEIAQCIYEGADALGVYVIVTAEHLCMTMRGIKKPGSKTITYAKRGVFENDHNLTFEALSLLNKIKVENNG